MLFKNAEVFIDGNWKPREFEHIVPGERFRTFYADGRPADGEAIADSTPVPCDPPGNWEIKATRVTT